MDAGMYPVALREELRRRFMMTTKKAFEADTGIRRDVAYDTIRGEHRCSLEKLFTIMEYLDLDTWENKFKPKRPFKGDPLHIIRHTAL